MPYPINVSEYLERSFGQHEDRIAVRDGERSISFKELRQRVLAEAAAISELLNGQTGKIVAVYLSKSLEAVIADLAIIYSGNAYMNLDVKSPRQRTEAILAQTEPSLVIGNGEEHGFPALAHHIGHAPAPDSEKQEQLFARLTTLVDTDLLCLINTSGSTGIPKTVALNHRSFIDFTEAVLDAGLIADHDIVGSLSPLIFDIFSFELCMLMAKGSTLVLIPDTLAAFPARMLELMQKERVSFIFWVPTIMVNIANMQLLDSLHLPDLRMIWFAGEVFPTAKFNYWRTSLPDAVFANFYGPIEITLDCLYQLLPATMPAEEPLPIGKPFRNTSVLVLDENDENVGSDEPGKEGELCVRGSSLALGYYNNPEKTRAAFTQNPLNHAYPETIYRTGDMVCWNTRGELIFRGRKDSLIKHSGYRIELGEIEHAAINSGAGLANVCALYDASAKKIILVYEAPKPLDEKNLRQQLAKALPRYMLPGHFVHVEEMPRNVNGKIDRNRLAQNCCGHQA